MNADPVCRCGRLRSEHWAHTGAFAGTTGARLLCNDYGQFQAVPPKADQAERSEARNPNPGVEGAVQ